MYKNHLEGALKGGVIPKSILLYGEEFYATYFAKKILSMLGDSENILSFYYDEYHFESAKNFISQPSLFGDVSILYIRSNKKIPKKELDILVEFCHKNSTSHFILQFSGDDKVGKDLQKSFGKKKSADFVRFFKPYMGEAIALLSERSRELNLDIDNYALQHLFLVQNEDLALSINELDKLVILDKKIYVADIDTHVFGLGEMGIDEFIVRLLDKKDIRDDLEKLLGSGLYDEIRVINTLQTYMVQLFLFHSYIKIHGSYNVIDILGFPLPPNLAKQRASQCIKIKLPAFSKIFKHLLDAEYTLKSSSNLDKNAFTFSRLIKLQYYL
jgi:DNA polymerase-3 subunit delta